MGIVGDNEQTWEANTLSELTLIKQSHTIFTEWPFAPSARQTDLYPFD